MLRKDEIEKLSFLMIDDNQLMLTILRTLLHGLGAHNIYEALDAARGLEELINNKVDIILLDNKMKTLDGLEFTRIVRSASDLPNHEIPIIMVSGYTESWRVKKARDAGVNEFIIKPLSAKHLMDRINEVITNPRTFIKSSKYIGPDRRRHINENYKGEERRKNKQSPSADNHSTNVK